MSEFLLTAALLALAVWGIVLFNRLVRWRNQVREAWSGIEVQLKRRHSLIPNLVEAAKAYGGYESGVLERLTALRSGEAELTPGAVGEAESRLTRDIRRLVAVAEAYPELKASDTYLRLMQGLTEAENQIQYARRYYNGAVRELNVLVQSFPSNLVAGLFRFRPAEYFEVELAAERQSPEVRL